MNIDLNPITNIIDELELIQDQLVTIQSMVYKEVLANMKCEDTKTAYNMLGEAQIALDGAMARLDNKVKK